MRNVFRIVHAHCLSVFRHLKCWSGNNVCFKLKEVGSCLTLSARVLSTNQAFSFSWNYIFLLYMPLDNVLLVFSVNRARDPRFYNDAHSLVYFRAVFKWLSKVTTRLRMLLVFGLKISRQFFKQWKPNQSHLVRAIFTRVLSVVSWSSLLCLE